MSQSLQQPVSALLDAGALRAPQRPPIVLLVEDQEWTARSLESVLGSGGFAVVRVGSARAALEQVRNVTPDLVVLRSELPDSSGAELCAELCSEHRLGPGTPLVVTTAGPMRREEQLAAFRAGAWEVLPVPVDAEELLLRMNVFVRSKLAADRAREESLVDPGTGLYSVHGLLRRLRELRLEAARQHTSLACVLVAAEPPLLVGDDDPCADALARRMLGLVLAVGRRSDAIGRLGPCEFAVVAPHTDAAGVLSIAQRFVSAAEAGDPADPDLPHLRIRVGCYAVDDLDAGSIDPVDILVRATLALRRAQRDSVDYPISYFKPPPAPS
ncbi:MAG TPA: response regulator [Longimicrobiaceae bacterium]|nr:response regulator [Longimicrobiaceae bacterium]